MFDFDFDDIFTPILLDWDKKNYKFNREEKDMHPYTIKYSEKEMKKSMCVRVLYFIYSFIYVVLLRKKEI